MNAPMIGSLQDQGHFNQISYSICSRLHNGKLRCVVYAIGKSIGVFNVYIELK